MQDLQRRIKRAWFPPKGNESKRVIVVFKVHQGGALSNLKISNGCGLAIADDAALQAVQHAAPFSPLPPGAPKDVDVQFTFDYNVFMGSGHGTFRQF
jgi:TonB family protein